MPSIGSADREQPSVLVLALGNLLLGDDAIGLHLLERLRDDRPWGPDVQFVDGGTQGLMLLGLISRRPAVLILDACGQGPAPGSVITLRTPDIAAMRKPHAKTAHEGNAGELLATATMLGEQPGEVAVVGIQPEKIATGIGLSETVRNSVEPALQQARSILSELIARCSCVSSDSRQNH